MAKSYYRLGDWRRNVLLITAAASLGLGLPACSDNSRSSESSDGEWSADDSYSEGVITEMTEVKPDDWKITAERPAGKEEVAAILHHLDGRVDTLQGQALQRPMQEYSRQYPENRVRSTGMMDVLMWSGIGYMAGRFLTPQPGYYANPGLMQQNMGWRNRVENERRRGSSFFGRGFTGSRQSPASTGIRPSPTVTRSTGYGRSSIRSSAPGSGRSSGFGSRGYGGWGFGG